MPSYIDPGEKPNPPVIIIGDDEYSEDEKSVNITADDDCDIYFTYTFDYNESVIGRVPDLNDIGSNPYSQTVLYNHNAYNYVYTQEDIDWDVQTTTITAVAVSKTGRKSDLSSSSCTWRNT